MDTATVKYLDNMAFTANVDNSKISIPLDATAEHGGDGDGFRPKPLMLVALAGCTGMDIASLVKKMRVEITDLQIETQADKSDQMPITYTAIRLAYRFTAPTDRDADKLRKIVEMSQERYCGVAHMMRSFATLTYTIELNGKIL